MGFKLEDITEAFLSRVVFYEFGHPSGLGDTAGSVTMLTEDGREYFIAGEGFEYPYHEWGKVFPVFDGIGALDAGGSEGADAEGDWVPFDAFAGDVFVRRDLAEAFKVHVEGGGEGCLFLLDAAVKALGLGMGEAEVYENRVVYDKTLEHWEAERRRRARWKADRERVALGPGDVEWREIPRIGATYAGPAGCFAVLHKRNDDGTFFTSIWSIEYQLDTDMRIDQTSRAGTYNLCHEKWARAPQPIPCEIVGEEAYRAGMGLMEFAERMSEEYGGHDPMEFTRKICDGRYFCESHARFVGSYPTLQLAKDGAMRRNACGGGWGGHTKENLLDEAGEFVFRMPEREEYEHDFAERPHPVICGKTADTWLVRMRDEDTGETIDLEWSHDELSAIMCEVPMSSEVPTHGSLLSIDPLSSDDLRADNSDPWR